MIVRASIAMAVYQGETYIKKQLDSIISQMGDDDELVISYDPSTDRTWEIINDYGEKDPRVFVVKNKECGVIGNFNNALSHCRGRYLFVADQDDIWLPGKIDHMVEALVKTGASLIVHNGVTIDESDVVISDDFFSMYRIGPSFWRNLLKSRYSGCCMAFTAGFAKIALPIPRDIDAYDRWLGLCAEKFGKIGFLEDVLIQHRVHGKNVTPTQRRLMSTIIKTRFAMINALRRKQKSLKL
jgi:glycosyltransferase involved in cell wall biosynthesis